MRMFFSALKAPKILASASTANIDVNNKATVELHTYDDHTESVSVSYLQLSAWIFLFCCARDALPNRVLGAVWGC